jgi:hypothetical protein
MTQKDLEILLRQAKSYYESELVISPVLLRRNKATGKKVPTFLYRFSDLSNYNWTFFKKLCKVYFNKYGYFNGLCCHVDRTKNLIIIDIDSEKASETISRMTGPKVLRSRTPSGGVHYWFETEKPVSFHQNRIIGYDIPRLVFLPGSRVEGPTEDVYLGRGWPGRA